MAVAGAQGRSSPHSCPHALDRGHGRARQVQEGLTASLPAGLRGLAAPQSRQRREPVPRALRPARPAGAEAEPEAQGESSPPPPTPDGPQTAADLLQRGNSATGLFSLAKPPSEIVSFIGCRPTLFPKYCSLRASSYHYLSLTSYFYVFIFKALIDLTFRAGLGSQQIEWKVQSLPVSPPRPVPHAQPLGHQAPPRPVV